MEHPRLQDIVEANGPQLLDVAFLITGDADRARDDLLAVIVQAHHDAGHDADASAVPDPLSVCALRRTLLRRCLRPRPDDAAAPTEDIMGTTHHDQTAGRHPALVTAYRQLPVRQRAVLALDILDQLPQEQIAQLLNSDTDAVACAHEQALARLASACPPGWSRQRVHDEATVALRDVAAADCSGENVWNRAQLAIAASTRRRRRVGMAFAGGGAAALLVIGGAVYVSPRITDARPAATTSTTGAPARQPPSAEMRRPDSWPLRGSLATSAVAALQRLRNDPQLSESGQSVDHFLFAGDVGQSRFVVATTSSGRDDPDVIGDMGTTAQLVTWVGPRGSDLATLRLGPSGFIAADLPGVVARDAGIDVPSGDLLVIAAPDEPAIRYSAEPVLGLDGRVSRSVRNLMLHDGIGMTRSGRLGGTGAQVTHPDTPESPAFVINASDESVIGASRFDVVGQPGARGGADAVDSLVTRFAALHKVPRSKVTVLDAQHVTMDGPSPDSSRHAQWSVEIVVVRTPDGRVFREGTSTVDGSSGGSDVEPLSVGGLLPADSWRHRPTVVLQAWSSAASAEPTTVAKVLAPGAAQVLVSGPGRATLPLARESAGVFVRPDHGVATGALDLTEMPGSLILTSVDAAGHMIGRWPAHPTHGIDDDGSFASALW